MPYENMLNILARGVNTKPTWDYMDSQLNALKYIGGMQDIQMAPEKMALERERVNIAKEGLGIHKEDLNLRKKEAEEKELDTFLQRYEKLYPILTYDNYDEVMAKISPSGMLGKNPLPQSKHIKEMAASVGATDPESARVYFEQVIKPGLKTTAIKEKEQMLETANITAQAHLLNALKDKKANEKYEYLMNPTTKEQREVLAGSPEVNKLLSMGWIKYEKQTDIKPTNMSAWYDSMGVERLGSKYDTPEGRKQFADWIGDPKNKKAISEYRQRYTDESTAKTYSVYPGGMGPSLLQTRGPGAGVLPPGQGAKMPAEVLTRLSDTKNIIGTMDILDDMASDPKMAKRFGPVDGRFTKIKQMFVEDGPTQEMMNNIESLIRVAYSLSGKQISYQEMELLKSAMLPQLNQPHLNFMATLKTARRWMESNYNDLLSTYTQSGYATNLQPIQPKTGSKPTEERKTIGSKNYIKINGKWYEE
jgi:hypothetical protein